MNRKKELLKNTMIITIGKVCTQLITFFLLPLYTNFLTTIEYGKIDLILTYVSLLAPLISLQLEYAIFRFLIDVRNHEEGQKKYISNSIILLIIMMLIVNLGIIIVSLFHKYNYLYISMVLIDVTMLSNLLLQIARGFGNNTAYSVGSLIAGVTTIIGNVIFLVVIKTSIEGIIYSQIIANILCIIYLSIRLKIWKYFNIKVGNKNVIKELLKYSMPMIPNSICWWIINVSDRTIISYMINMAANGIYSVSSKFPSAITSIYNIFNLSWTESVALHINDADGSNFFSETINEIIKFFLCVCLICISIIPLVFNIIIGSEYREAYKYIPILIVGAFFNVIMGLLSAIYIGTKNTNKMMKSTILAAIVNIIINLMFIKKIGLYAAAISTAISYFIVSIYRYFDIQKYLKLKLNNKIIKSGILISFVVIFVYYIDNIYLNVINFILVTIFSIFENYAMIKKITKGISERFLNNGN